MPVSEIDTWCDAAAQGCDRVPNAAKRETPFPFNLPLNFYLHVGFD